MWSITSPDGTPMAEPARFALARDLVRYVGEPVAVVVAETQFDAQDAAERVAIDYDERPAVTDAKQAMALDLPRLDQRAPSNICFRWARGDLAAVTAAFDRAPHIVDIDLVNQRIGGAAIEPRAVLAIPPVGRDKLTLYTATQVPHHIRRLVAEQLGISEAKLRVIAPDVGGGFGYKGKQYAEETVLPGRLASGSRSGGSPAAARALCRIIRGAITRPAPGSRWMQWGQVSSLSASIRLPTSGLSHLRRGESERDLHLLAGVYRTPAIFVERIGVFTNTAPTDAYRGAAGRRPATCWSASPTAQRIDLDLTALKSAGAILFRRSRCRIGRRSAQPTTAAIFQRFSSAHLQSPTIGAFRSVGRPHARSAGFAASAWPALSNHRASRHPALPACSERGRASMSWPQYHSSRTAACGRDWERIVMVRAMPPAWRRFLATRLGVPADRIRSSKATPILCLWHWHVRIAPYRGWRFGACRAAARSSPRKPMAEASAGDVDLPTAFSVAGTDRSVTFAEELRSCGQCAAQFSAGNGRAGPAGDRGL